MPEPPDDYYRKRFTDVLRVLCGGKTPPDNLVRDWLNDVERDTFGEWVDNLQDWVSLNSSLPWAFSITQIEAAESIAAEVEVDRAATCGFGPTP